MKDNLIKIDNVLLTVAELLIAWVMLGLSNETMTVARAGGIVRAIADASPRPPRLIDPLGIDGSNGTSPTYEDCAAGYKACEMLILAGVAEWANKTHSAIRATEGGREHKKDISNAYTKWVRMQAKTAGLAWDKAVSTASLTENTVDTFTVGTLVRYKKDASRNTSDKRLGVVFAIDKMGTSNTRLVHVNWGAYGTFWDRVRNLEVVNASR